MNQKPGVNELITLPQYNALKHGISSKIEVLPWERVEDLENFRQGFIEDFKPQSHIEEQLVLDLALISFKKQRIHRAENAAILHELASRRDCWLAKEVDLLCLHGDLKEAKLDIKEALYRKISVQEYISIIKSCTAVLNNHDSLYEEALASLSQDIQDLWHEGLQDEWQNYDYSYRDNVHGLKAFLQDYVAKMIQKRDIIQAREQIKQQATGMAYVPSHNLEKIQKYETTLNRDFERKLAMLLKLKDLRGQKVEVSES